MKDKWRNTAGSVVDDADEVQEIKRNFENMLDNFKKTGAESPPDKVSVIIGRIEHELKRLEKQICTSDSPESDPDMTKERISPSQINLYRNAVSRALDAVCSNILTNTREIERLNDIITKLPNVTSGELTMKRMLANIDTSKKSASISRREKEVLIQLLHGKTNREISKELGISEKTVKNHLWKIYQKLGVENRTQLFNWLIST